MSVGLPDAAPWLLLEEMMHRVANEYVTAASMLLLSAAKASSSDSRDAINAASDLLQQYAKVHKPLQLPRRGARLDLSNYLSDLCLALAKAASRIAISTSPLWWMRLNWNPSDAGTSVSS
jgi:two-component sensor histidine kinase